MKLTLDKSWELCLKQWRWIAKRIRADNEYGAVALKYVWLRKNGIIKQPHAGCFFCEYGKQHKKGSSAYCDYCPAKKIDKEFYCEHPEYHYSYLSLKFYAKLLKLNRKRKKCPKP